MLMPLARQTVKLYELINIFYQQHEDIQNR